VPANVRTMLAAVATGILLFLLWDVLTHAVEPVEDALKAGHDGRFLWLTTLLAGGFAVGLLSLVYYDAWMKARRRKAFLLGPGAASPAELQQQHEYHFAGLSPAKWLAAFLPTRPAPPTLSSAPRPASGGVLRRVHRHRHRPAQLLRGPGDRPVRRERRDQPGHRARDRL